jgi:hypothetical protein
VAEGSLEKGEPMSLSGASFLIGTLHQIQPWRSCADINRPQCRPGALRRAWRMGSAQDRLKSMVKKSARPNDFCSARGPTDLALPTIIGS